MKLASFITLIFWYSHSMAQEFYYKTLSTEDGLPSNQIHSVYSDSRGYIWFGTPNGAVRWDSKSFKTYTIEDGLPNNEVLGFFEDSKRRLWISNFSNELCFLKDNIIYNSKNNSVIASNKVNTASGIFEYENRLFFFGINGVSSFNLLDLKNVKAEPNFFNFTNFYVYKNKLYGYRLKIPDSVMFNQEKVLSIFRSGKILSTQEEYNNNKFSKFVIDSILIPKYKNTIRNNLKKETRYIDVQNMLFIINDKLKIFTKDVNVLNFNTFNVTKLISFKEKLYFFSNNVFYDLKNKKVGELPTNFGKFYNFNKINDNKYTITASDDILEFNNRFQVEKFGMKKKYVYNIKHLFYQSIYNQYYIGTGSFLYACRNNKIKTIKEFKTYCSFIDSRKRLWYSGLDNVYFSDRYEDTIIDEKQFVLNSKITVFVKDIQEDKYGNIIFVTNDGVYIYSYKENVLYRLDKTNILSANECNKIHIDKQDNSLWITTPSGLNHIRYYESNGKLRFEKINRFFKTDGLYSDEINDVIVSGDSVWVATTKGLSLIKNKNYRPDTVLIPIQINSITIDDYTYFKESIDELKYTQNNLTIDYSALYFLRRDRLAIFYKLIKGNDTSTQELVDSKLSLLSLSSGEYKLLLYAYDRDYPYNKSEFKTLIFKIKTPYYQTWWFYLLILLSIIWIAYLIFRNRIKRSREIHEYETKLSQLKLEALKAEMNPHFIFNCLNAIKDYIMKNDTEKSQYYLDKLSKLIRQALYNSKDDFVNLRNEIQFIDNYVELENMRFDHHFDYFKEIDIEKFGHIQIPTMILQPFFENAIRHGKLGQMERRGKLFFTIFEDKNLLVIKIMDNGIGIEEAEKIKVATQSEHRSMAISIIKDRIEVYNKSYLLDISYTLSSIEDEEYKTQVVLTINLNNL